MSEVIDLAAKRAERAERAAGGGALQPFDEADLGPGEELQLVCDCDCDAELFIVSLTCPGCRQDMTGALGCEHP